MGAKLIYIQRFHLDMNDGVSRLLPFLLDSNTFLDIIKWMLRPVFGQNIKSFHVIEKSLSSKLKKKEKIFPT